MARRGGGGELMVLVFGVLLLLSYCTGDDDKAGPTPEAASSFASTPAPESRSLYTRYVRPRVLNVRSGPSTAGPVVEKLQTGARVEVYESLDGWARVAPLRESARWVSEGSLCTEPDCGRSSLASAAAWRPQRASRQSSSSGSSCPCSSSNNCFGPRGGRYCITSGGNKRYR